MHSVRNNIQHFFVKTPEYVRLESEIVEEGPNGGNNTDVNSILLRRRRWSSIAPWILCIVLACFNLYLLSTRSRLPVPKTGTFWTGFHHELHPATAHIDYQEVQFSGSADWDDDGKLSLTHIPGEPLYVGEPTQEIDDAWNDLIRDRFFFLSEEEAKAQYGDRYSTYVSPTNGGYRAYVDALHLLHCLNRLRQSYHPDRYINETKGVPVPPMTHNYHCIELLRQSVMCHADLTVIPVRFFPGLGASYIDANQPHTCRNFTKIQEWLRSRKGLFVPTPP